MKINEAIKQNKSQVYWFEYPKGRLPYGRGGWSKQAKYRPRPVLKTATTDQIKESGRSVIVDGKRKLKVTIIQNGKIVREDYSIEDITKLEGEK